MPPLRRRALTSIRVRRNSPRAKRFQNRMSYCGTGDYAFRVRRTTSPT